MKNNNIQTKKEDDKKCNENWHIFNNGDDKPCQCGEIKSFNEYIGLMVIEKLRTQNDTN